MDLGYILCLYVLIVIAVAILIYKSGLNVVGSIVLSILVGQIILNIIKPVASVNRDDDQASSELLFYLSIQYGTPVVCLGFLIYYAIRDKRPCYSI